MSNRVGKVIARQSGDVFTVERVYAEGGAIVCDLVHPRSFRRYVAAPLLGGGRTRQRVVAPDAGDDVAVLYLQSGYPVVLGVISDDHGVVPETDVDRSETTEDNASSSRSPEDVWQSNGGSEVVIHRNGNVTIVLAPGAVFRVQGASGGVSRMSTDGSASDRVVAVTPWAAHAEEQRRRVVALEGKVSDLLSQQETTLNAAALGSGTAWRVSVEAKHLGTPIDGGPVNVEDFASPSLLVAEPGFKLGEE